MPNPSVNISDIVEVNQYIKETNAALEITSVVSGLSVSFPAFLTDFSQTFDATWNTEDVFGRMDPIATYQGTKRTMSLGFDVVAGSKDGAKDNLEYCAKLVKMVYPVYRNTKLTKPPLVRVKFANLICGTIASGGQTTTTGANADSLVTGETNTGLAVSDGITDNAFNPVDVTAAITSTTPSVNKNYVGLLGWISGLSWKPSIEMGMFTSNKNLYPKVISISFSFNVLHEHSLSQTNSAANFPFKIN